MSFILDALKKSESDRQRQSGPALFEVKVAPPRYRFPVWAIAIVALLVINMVIVGWMLVRRLSRDDDATAANTAGPPLPAAVVQPQQTPAPAAAPPATPLAPPATASPPPATQFSSQSAAATQGAPPAPTPAPTVASAQLQMPATIAPPR